ncbi:Uncharacterized protein APZ42_003961, partial [Daphnia magna]
GCRRQIERRDLWKQKIIALSSLRVMVANDLASWELMTAAGGELKQEIYVIPRDLHSPQKQEEVLPSYSPRRVIKSGSSPFMFLNFDG